MDDEVTGGGFKGNGNIFREVPEVLLLLLLRVDIKNDDADGVSEIDSGLVGRGVVLTIILKYPIGKRCGKGVCCLRNEMLALDRSYPYDQ